MYGCPMRATITLIFICFGLKRCKPRVYKWPVNIGAPLIGGLFYTTLLNCKIKCGIVLQMAIRLGDQFNGKPSFAPVITKRVPLPKKKKLTQKEIWAQYGLQKPQNPRYTGLKGIYWHVVSEFVRRRDFTVWGTCVSCGKRMESWKHMQAGHFIAASTCGFKLLFDLRNINSECGYCNGFDANHLFFYEINLDTRYGKGVAQSLKDRYAKSRRDTPAKGWNDKQYDEAIRQLQGELIHLR